MSKQAARYLVSGLAACCLLFACTGEPLPDDMLEYAGSWVTTRTEQVVVHLSITAGGQIDYEKRDGGSTTSLNGPIQSYTGDDFTVGVGCANTTFEVSEAPNQLQDGTWTMVVDGRRLIRLN